MAKEIKNAAEHPRAEGCFTSYELLVIKLLEEILAVLKKG
jgi:hypothetical protein